MSREKQNMRDIMTKQIKEEFKKLLFEAVREKNIKNIKNALNNGADVNVRDQHENTPLIIATPFIFGSMKDINKNIEVAELLIKEGADVNAKNKNGRTALHYASDLMRINPDSQIDGMTPEQLKESRSNIIKLLLRYNSDINAIDKNGDTPLHLAAYMGADDIVDLLIKSGADLNIINNSGKTPSEYTSNKDVQEIFNKSAARSSDQREGAKAENDSFLSKLFGHKSKGPTTHFSSRAEQSPAAGSSNQGERAAAGSVRSWRSILTGTRNEDPMTKPLLDEDNGLGR